MSQQLDLTCGADEVPGTRPTEAVAPFIKATYQKRDYYVINAGLGQAREALHEGFCL